MVATCPNAPRGGRGAELATREHAGTSVTSRARCSGSVYQAEGAESRRQRERVSHSSMPWTSLPLSTAPRPSSTGCSQSGCLCKAHCNEAWWLCRATCDTAGLDCHWWRSVRLQGHTAPRTYCCHRCTVIHRALKGHAHHITPHLCNTRTQSCLRPYCVRRSRRRL